MVREVRGSPETIATLEDPRFVTIAWTATTAVICYTMWQVLQVGRPVGLTVQAALVVTSILVWWNLIDLDPPPLRIDLSFDDSAGLPTVHARR